MKKRNSKLAALSIAVAASAIGAGALVSGNAMAGSDDDAAANTDTVSLVELRAGEGGQDAPEAIACTFDGVDLPALAGASGAGGADSGPIPVAGEIEAGELAAGVVIEGQAVQQFPDAGDGTKGQSFTVSVDGEVTHSESIDAELPADGEPIEVTGGGGIIGETSIGPADALPDDAQVIDAAEVREGTEAECAEILGSLTAP